MSLILKIGELIKTTTGKEKEGKIFIEPIVRKHETHSGYKSNDFHSVTLEYTMEVGINSIKGTTFKRVEKKVIKGGTMNK